MDGWSEKGDLKMKKYSTIKKTIYKEDGLTSEDILIIRYRMSKKRYALMSEEEIKFLKSKYEKSKLFAKVIPIPEYVEVRFVKDTVFFDCEYDYYLDYEYTIEFLYELRKYLKENEYKVIILSMFLDKEIKLLGVKNGELAKDRYSS